MLFFFPSDIFLKYKNKQENIIGGLARDKTQSGENRSCEDQWLQKPVWKQLALPPTALVTRISALPLH